MLSNSPRQHTLLRLEARKSFSPLVRVVYPNTAAVDMTGATVRFVLAQPGYLGGTVLLNIEATHVTPLEGLLQFEIQAAQLDLPAAEYPFSLVLITADGYSATAAKGTVELAENTDPTMDVYTAPNPAEGILLWLHENNELVIEVNSVFFPDTVAQQAIDAAAAAAVSATASAASSATSSAAATTASAASVAAAAAAETAQDAYDANAGTYITSSFIRICETLTQAQYDALAVKDPETLYVIV